MFRRMSESLLKEYYVKHHEALAAGKGYAWVAEQLGISAKRAIAIRSAALRTNRFTVEQVPPLVAKRDLEKNRYRRGSIYSVEELQAYIDKHLEKNDA